jgi:hypothetical protein
MGLKNFSIEFDSPSGLYYAGGNVTGKVKLSIDTPKKIRGIYFKIYCYTKLLA